MEINRAVKLQVSKHQLINKGAPKSEVIENSELKKSQLIEFTVRYSGKAVESNEMNADELATSLLGISNALEEANSIINFNNPKLFVKVRGSFKPGSFIVDIATFLNTDTIQTVFNSENIGTIANVTTILGFAGFGGGTCKTLIWLFKHTKGKKILTKKPLEGNNCEVTIEGCDSPIVINNYIVNLYEEKKIRQAFEYTVSPLNNEGISDITFLVDGKEQEKILKDERSYFSPSNTEDVEEKEDVDCFIVTRSDFEGRQTGWRLSFGASSQSKNKLIDFPVKILDETFLHKVSTRELIISNQGTIIKARYKKRIQKSDRLIVNWEILEVLNTEYSTQNHNKSLNYTEKTLEDY